MKKPESMCSAPGQRLAAMDAAEAGGAAAGADAPAPGLPAGPGGVQGTGLTGAGHHLLEAVDHHLLAGCQAAGDDPVIALAAGQLDRPRRDLVVGAHHQHGVALGAAGDGLLRQQDGLGAVACTSRTLTYRPGSSRPCGLGSSARRLTWPVAASTSGRRTAACRAAGRSLPSSSTTRTSAGAAPGALQRPGLHRLAQRSTSLAALGEVDVQRADLLDQRQLGGLALAHQRAFGDQRAADAAR
jgi:hypothetical protein